MPSPRPDAYLESLVETYLRCVGEERRLSRVHDDHPDHPDLLAAERATEAALHRVMAAEAVTPAGFLLKLRLACHFGHPEDDALEPGTSVVMPRLLLSLKGDLERRAWRDVEEGMWGPPDATPA